MDNQQQKKSAFSFDKKEIMYALIVVFLLFIMYYLGQISTHNIYEDVSKMVNCSSYQIQSLSPFGVTLVKSFETNISGFPFNTYNPTVTNESLQP